MLDAKRMQLKGLAVRTQEAYVNAVLQLSRHFKKSPDSIDEQELREYFLYLKNIKTGGGKYILHCVMRDQILL